MAVNKTIILLLCFQQFLQVVEENGSASVLTVVALKCGLVKWLAHSYRLTWKQEGFRPPDPHVHDSLYYPAQNINCQTRQTSRWRFDQFCDEVALGSKGYSLPLVLDS